MIGKLYYYFSLCLRTIMFSCCPFIHTHLDTRTWMYNKNWIQDPKLAPIQANENYSPGATMFKSLSSAQGKSSKYKTSIIYIHIQTRQVLVEEISIKHVKDPFSNVQMSCK